MIIFDLEWNSGLYERVRLDEILQIGAVRLDRPGGRVTDVFSAYVRPTVHKRYSPAAQALPELALCQASELDFPAAAAAFARWSRGETQFAAWGGSDYPVLLQNLRHWHIDLPLPDSYFDLQSAFSAAAGARGQMALYRAVEYCGIPDVFDYHAPLNDALYTALVAGFLRPEELAAAVRVPAEVLLRQRAEKLAKQVPPSLGPFDSRDAMLKARSCRLAVCPVCGRKDRVNCWYYVGDGPYYTKFSCPDHGPFLLELTAAPDRRSRLRAGSQVLPNTEENRALLRAARKGTFFQLQGKAASRKRRRRGRARLARASRGPADT